MCEDSWRSNSVGSNLASIIEWSVSEKLSWRIFILIIPTMDIESFELQQKCFKVQPVGRCHQKKHGKITRRHVWSYPLGMIFTTYIFIVRLGMVYGMNGLPHEYTWIISNRTTNHVLIIDHLLLSDILVLGYVDMAVSQNVLAPPRKKGFNTKFF